MIKIVKRERKDLKNEQNFSCLWDNSKWFNIYIIGCLKGEKEFEK